ncbi:hypothetical protein SDJN02_24256, partial [Cucurbita argyrosperma subsp. argyrosperma]
MENFSVVLRFHLGNHDAGLFVLDRILGWAWGRYWMNASPPCVLPKESFFMFFANLAKAPDVGDSSLLQDVKDQAYPVL